MALVLSSSESSTMEPVRKNRWVMQFKSIPGNDSNSNAKDKLGFVAHTCSIPSVSFGQTEYHRINERFYNAGKPTFNELSMTFYDFIQGTNSASQILYNWLQKVYNPLTGQMGFKKQYSTSGTLAQLDPMGGVIRTWNLFYVWPASVDFGGSLSSEDDGFADISVTFRYDLAIKGVDIDTTPTA